MITYAAFGALRLRQSVDPSTIDTLDDRESLERRRVGEAFGPSGWLRLERSPAVLRSLSLDLLDVPADQARRVLALLGLPLAVAMRRQQVEAVLGDPVRTLDLASDRVTYEHVTAGRQPYEVSCTSWEDSGLACVVVARPRRSLWPRSRAARHDR